MKKVLIALSALALLTACSTDNTAKVSDGETVYINSENEQYTKQDLFESMKNNDYTAVVTNHIVTRIAELEGVDMTEVDSEAQTRLEEMQTSFGTYYTQLEAYYGGAEKIKANIAATVCNEKLAERYIDLNFDSLVEENIPVKMQIAYFDDIEVARKALEEINAGTSFDIAVLNNGYTTDASAQVYLDSDSLALEVKEYVNSGIIETGVSEIINTATSTTDSEGNQVTSARYYIINIIDRDANNFKDEFVDKLLLTFDTTESTNYFFSQHDIQFYDQRTYDLVSSTYGAVE